ncbi:MAG: hypothetical protein E2O51_07400 [Gammaproteobacteria bacterium]|nr:MAG: hypothetical protein E2O51_07400 [Gammaproteobacteria bacterium]
MRKANVAGLLLAGLAAVTMGAHAHHSNAAFFILDQTISVQGVVKEFWFENPHTRIYLDVTNADGDVEEWMLEGRSRNVLTRQGWSADTLSVGITIQVEGNPSRDGSKSLGWRSLKSMDGDDIGP